MNLRDMVNSYSSGNATATSATPATRRGLAVARVATVAVASGQNHKERLAKRWQWFLLLATEHSIHPDVVGAEFPNEQDRLDVVEPLEQDDKLLRGFMAAICTDARVLHRQIQHETSRLI